eukprot:249707-Chlamydomonas_euryale.AAC.1
MAAPVVTPRLGTASHPGWAPHSNLGMRSNLRMRSNLGMRFNLGMFSNLGMHSCGRVPQSLAQARGAAGPQAVDFLSRPSCATFQSNRCGFVFQLSRWRRTAIHTLVVVALHSPAGGIASECTQRKQS